MSGYFLTIWSRVILCLSAQVQIHVLLGSEQASCQLSRHAASTYNAAIDLQAAPVALPSPSCMILHVMMHLPKILVTRLLPVSPALEEMGTLRHLLTVKA